MPDEITSNPAPVDTQIPQVPETPISTPPEAVIAPAPVEAPTDPIPTPEPIPEPQTAQMGGNEPLAEPVQVETEPIPAQPPAPGIHEAIAPAETTPVAQVETPASAPAEVVAPIVAAVVATLNSPRLGASGEASATRIEASPQAPLAENINSQTFTKSMRELFTKALNARQNRKKMKLDRILSLFAKQTMITNNEVEKLLHISDATATRYLSTLEKEGKIKQNKKTGKGVSYSKI